MTTELRPWAALRRFARGAQTPAQATCELCRRAIAAEHSHLTEVAARRLVCCCEPCAVLFQDGGSAGSARFQRLPRDVTALADFRLSDAVWQGLVVPIGMAFFYCSTPARGVVAGYPSPGGATEALIAAEPWAALVAENPILGELEADVEALLVNRVQRGAAREPEYYRVPIDVCFALVGLVRMHWRGLSGGDGLWGELDGFFENLRRRSGAPRCAAHA